MDARVWLNPVASKDEISYITAVKIHLFGSSALGMKATVFFLLIWQLLALPLAAQDHPYDWDGRVWYEILPERFRNYNPSNDPVKGQVVDDEVEDWQVHPWASDWYKLQIWEQGRDLDFYQLIEQRRYGGDLLGVIEKLPYLQALGVEVILLTPIFESPSITKFDAATFHHADNNFGTDPKGDLEKIKSENDDTTKWSVATSDQAFWDLLSEAQDADMRVVMDVVFNYCSKEFWAFRDLEEKQQDSRYKDWFVVYQWDDPLTPDSSEFEYKCWHGNRAFPEFKQDENGLDEGLKKYIFDATRRWLDPDGDGDPVDGVAGFRVRHVTALPASFWEAWTQMVRDVNPNALLVGDVSDSSTEWLGEKRFDSVTDYGWRELVIDFFIKDAPDRLRVSEFDARLRQLRERYGAEHELRVLNLLGGVEMPRIASLLRNRQVLSDGTDGVAREQFDPRPPSDSLKANLRALALFQLTYPGSPMIFYGDEAGMWGGPYPDNVKPMLWPEFVYDYETYATIRPDLRDEVAVRFDRKLFHAYRSVNKVRHNYPALRKGSFVPRLIDDQRDVYVFSRIFEKNEMVVFLNNSDEKQDVGYDVQKKDGAKVKDVLNDRNFIVKNGHITVPLQKKWGAILVKSK